MRLISFNVNGIRSILNKDSAGNKNNNDNESVSCLEELCNKYVPDILCLQEIKTSDSNDLNTMQRIFPHIYSNHSVDKKGYSGVALLSTIRPLRIFKDFEWAPKSIVGNVENYAFNSEGRIITAEYDNMIIVNCYVPNSKHKLTRLSERIIWERVMRNYIWWLSSKGKCVILCGDLNCAYQEIDIHNPKNNMKSPGFSKEEREEFSRLIDDCGLVDSFRILYPNSVKYTYWSNFANARKRNMGWRIDYFLVSESWKEFIKGADCLNQYFGSDHCPVLLDIEL